MPYVIRSFLGTPHRFATVAVRYAEGAAFDLRCRSCQATSSITSSVPLNEIASPAGLPSNSAYIGAWVEMPMISLPSRAGRRDHAGLSTTCPS